MLSHRQERFANPVKIRFGSTIGCRREWSAVGRGTGMIRRKAEVVTAVRNGLIGLDEACERYRLSVEEFLSWEQMVNAHGLRGLRITRTQVYRQFERDDNPAQRLSQDGIGQGTAES